MRRSLPLLLFAALGVAVALRVLAAGALHGDDAYNHHLWAQQLATGLDAGTPRPLWAADANHGCGSPALRYYPPVSLYATQLMLPGRVGVPAALALSAALALALAAAAMFACARRWLAAGPATVAALAYALAPYPLLDLGYRAAMGELWALVWAPLLLGALLDRRTGLARRIAGVAAGAGLLLLTHLPSAVLWALLSPALAAALALLRRDRAALVAAAAGWSIAPALAAFYLAPLVATAADVTLDDLARYDPVEHLLFTGGGSDPVLATRVALAAGACAALALAAGTVGWALRDRGADGGGARAVALAGGSLATIAMASPLSAPLWVGVPGLAWIGFPWRWLVAASALAALGAGLAAQRVVWSDTTASRRRIAAVALAGTAAATLALSIWIVVDHRGLGRDAPFELWPSMDYAALEANLNVLNPRALTLRDVGEYRPRWSVGHRDDDPMAVVMPVPFFRGDRALHSGDGDVTVRDWAPERRVVDVDARDAGQLLVRTFYVPQWHATSADGPLPCAPHPGSGLLTIEVPAGAQTVTLTFARGPVHRLGWSISLAALAAVAGLGLRGRRRAKVEDADQGERGATPP